MCHLGGEKKLGTTGAVSFKQQLTMEDKMFSTWGNVTGSESHDIDVQWRDKLQICMSAISRMFLVSCPVFFHGQEYFCNNASIVNYWAHL